MRDVSVLRVFTRGGDGGNHLGVVTDLGGLDSSSMQAIAFELGYSETIFLDDSDVRIFTPIAELPFAGHPLVGAAWVVGHGKDGAAGSLNIEIGEVTYEIDDGLAWVALDMPGPVTEVLTDTAALFGIGGVKQAAVVEMPLPYLVFEVSTVSEVASASPDFDAIAADGREVYLIAQDGAEVRARFFAPNLGVAEDPATGSAAVALAAVRNFRGIKSGAVVIDQGREVGQPCLINLRWGEGRASIGGTVRQDEARSV